MRGEAWFHRAFSLQPRVGPLLCPPSPGESELCRRSVLSTAAELLPLLQTDPRHLPAPRNLHEKLPAPSALPGRADAPGPRSPQTHAALCPAAPRRTPRSRQRAGPGAGSAPPGTDTGEGRAGGPRGLRAERGCGGRGTGPAEPSAPVLRFRRAAGSGAAPPRWLQGGRAAPC